jgi:hypothetical protein
MRKYIALANLFLLTRYLNSKYSANFIASLGNRMLVQTAII